MIPLDHEIFMGYGRSPTFRGLGGRGGAGTTTGPGIGSLPPAGLRAGLGRRRGGRGGSGLTAAVRTVSALVTGKLGHWNILYLPGGRGGQGLEGGQGKGVQGLQLGRVRRLEVSVALRRGEGEGDPVVEVGVHRAGHGKRLQEAGTVVLLRANVLLLLDVDFTVLGPHEVEHIADQSCG